MTVATLPKLESHPPLARDAFGNLVPVPDGTVALRICRETHGRPRGIRGLDKNLVRFPVHTTCDDLLDLCGPGAYRVYALDQLGELLSDDPIARWDLATPTHEPRNAAVDPMAVVQRVDRSSNATGASTTDLRFALETMAQMMRTNSDALRLVAESQVDLAKAIATVKGLPRNAAMYLPPTTPTRAANDDDDGDDDEDDEDDVESQQAAPTNYFDLLKPFSEAFAPKLAEMVPAGLFGGAAANIAPAEPVAAASDSAPVAADDDIANRPFEAREVFDLNYARRKGEAKRAAATQGTNVRERAMTLQARIMRDPQLRQQAIAIQSSLAPDEAKALMSALTRVSDEQQTKFLETIRPLTADAAVTHCREVLKVIHAHQARTSDEKGGDVTDSQ